MRHPKKRSVDPQYFHGQVGKLIELLKVTLEYATATGTSLERVPKFLWATTLTMQTFG